MSDFSGEVDDIPEQEEQKTENEVRLIEASIPEVETEPEQSSNIKMTKDGKVMPETVEIHNKTKVLPYVTSQSPRKKHFRFINDADREQLTGVLESIPGLTVEYSTVRDKPYILLKKETTPVGKIHFLYYNENTPEDKYIKLYLFDFVDSNLYNTVKDKLVQFFENFKSSKQLGGRKKSHRKHRTHKKKRVIHRKTTLRRK
jgi:hypothetical protein